MRSGAATGVSVIVAGSTVGVWAIADQSNRQARPPPCRRATCRCAQEGQDGVRTWEAIGFDGSAMVTAALVAGAFAVRRRRRPRPLREAMSATRGRTTCAARGHGSLRTELLQQHFPDGVEDSRRVAQIDRIRPATTRTSSSSRSTRSAALKPPANLKAKMSKLLSTAGRRWREVVARADAPDRRVGPVRSVNKQSLALGLTDCAS